MSTLRIDILGWGMGGFGHMNTWTPLFSKIVDSSIWAEPDYVCKVFITMLALKDADQVVRYSAFGLAQRAHKTEKEVLDALKILSSPDRRRLEKQPHEGRRIERVEGGWLILSGQHYEDMMRSVNRKAYKAMKQREYRLKRGVGKNGSGKSQDQVRAEAEGRERRYCAAVDAGDEAGAEKIAAEGLE